MPHTAWVKRLRPLTLEQSSGHECNRSIEGVLIVARTLQQQLVVVISACRASQMRDRPVVVGVLKGLANHFVFLIAWNVAHLAVVAEPAIVVVHRALSPQWVCL